MMDEVSMLDVDIVASVFSLTIVCFQARVASPGWEGDERFAVGDICV